MSRPRYIRDDLHRIGLAMAKDDFKRVSQILLLKDSSWQDFLTERVNSYLKTRGEKPLAPIKESKK